jgi:hypothetical protein
MTTGFFTEEQLDRINLKTMATPLPGNYTGQELMSLLVTRTKENESELATQDTTEWYCRAKPSEVQAAFNTYEKTTVFQKHFQILTLMHERPEEFQKAMEAIENGWRPEE